MRFTTANILNTCCSALDDRAANPKPRTLARVTGVFLLITTAERFARTAIVRIAQLRSTGILLVKIPTVLHRNSCEESTLTVALRPIPTKQGLACVARPLRGQMKDLAAKALRANAVDREQRSHLPMSKTPDVSAQAY